MLAHIQPEEFTATLDGCVGRLLSGAQITEPPVDAFLIAKRLGITVARDDRQAGRARCVRLAANSATGISDQRSILIRQDPREERQHWAVAHELGEYHASELFRQLDIIPNESPPAAREQLANELANRILLPTPWVKRIGSSLDWDLRKLKERFTTASHELIARRTLELAGPAVVTIVDNGQVNWRRGCLGGRLPPWSPLEKRGWKRAHEAKRDIALVESPWRLRVWAIHEPEWQREIMRLEFVAGYEPPEDDDLRR